MLNYQRVLYIKVISQTIRSTQAIAIPLGWVMIGIGLHPLLSWFPHPTHWWTWHIYWHIYIDRIYIYYIYTYIEAPKIWAILAKLLGRWVTRLRKTANSSAWRWDLSKKKHQALTPLKHRHPKANRSTQESMLIHSYIMHTHTIHINTI